jgi:hypothetical protein
MATLVVLAGRLPGHTQPGGDLEPADAQSDRLVDQDREFRRCLLLRTLGALNPLQHLGWGQAGTQPVWTWWRGWCLLPSTRLYLPGFRIRPALRSGHVIHHAGEV